MAAAQNQQAAAAQEQAPEAPQRNPNVFFNVETGQHEFIVNYTYDDLTAYRDGREPEISVSQVNPAYVRQHPDAQISKEVQAARQAEKAAEKLILDQLSFGSFKEAKASAEMQGGTLEYHGTRYYHDTGEAFVYTRMNLPQQASPTRYVVDDPQARQQVYYEAAQNVMSRVQQSGGGMITSEAIDQEVQFLLGTKYQEGIPVSKTADISEFYQANFSSAAFQAQFEESDKERRKREAEERQRMRQEMYDLGYGGETISIDAKGNRTYHFVPRVGRPQYEYVSDPMNPFNVEKVPISDTSPPEQQEENDVNPFTPKSTEPGAAALAIGRNIADTLYTTGLILAAAPTAFFGGKDSAQAWYDIEYESKRFEERYQPELEGDTIGLAVRGTVEGVTTGQITETQKQSAQFQQAIRENPAYFAESGAASLALWVSPVVGVKIANIVRSSTLFRRLTTGRPYEITPRLHYPQTDYDPFNTGWFRSDNVPQRAFASSEPFSPSTVQKVTVATQAATQTPVRTTTSRRIDVPEGINPDPTPQVSINVIRRRTMTTLQDIDKRLGLDVRDRGSYTEVKTSSGTLLLQKRRPQQLRQETQTIQETTQTTATAQQQPIELLRVETEPPRPRPRPRPKEEPPKLDVQVRQTQNQITRASGSQRNQILVDLRQMGMGAMDAKTRQKQLLERQITLQTTQKIAQKPKLRAEQVRMTAQTQQSAAIQAYQQQFALKTQQLARTKPISLATQKYDFVRTTPGKGITLIKDPPKRPVVTIKEPPKPLVVKLPPMFGKGKKGLKVKDQLGITNLEKLAVANPFAPGLSILGKGDQAKGAKYLLSGSKKRGKKNKGLFDV